MKCIIVIVVFAINVHFIVCILGGYEISITKAPYQVNYGDVCGGVLIDKRWVLTTAHCGTHDFIRTGDKYRLRGFKVKVMKHIVHPYFQLMHAYDFDIQLLLLSRSLHFKENIGKINIERRGYGEKIRVFGWGYEVEKGDYKDILQTVVLWTIPMRICQMFKQSWFNNTLTDRMFCAGGLLGDACQGDSGGAAVSKGRLVGLSSFGFGCGRKIPGVYVDLANNNIRKWIWENTGI